MKTETEVAPYKRRDEATQEIRRRPNPDSLGTLYQISRELNELFARREELGRQISELGADPDKLRGIIENLLAETEDGLRVYCEAEVRKVDNICAYAEYCRVMEAAAADQEKKANAHKKKWAGRLERLKEGCKIVLQDVLHATNVTGAHGAIRLCKNGGSAPHPLVAMSDLPMYFTKSAPELTWVEKDTIMQALKLYYTARDGTDDAARAVVIAAEMKMTTAIMTPNMSLIVAALNERCANCAGAKTVPCWPCAGKKCKQCEGTGVRDCTSCNGTGDRTIPGVYKQERGSHVRID